MADNNNWMGLALAGLIGALAMFFGFKFMGNHHHKDAGMYHHHFGRPMGGAGHAGSMNFNKSDKDSCLPCSTKKDL